MPWRSIQDTHAGETCLIIGNGPSLAFLPLAFLKKYPSFGVNKIFKLQGFIPTYYVASDRYMLEKCHGQMKGLARYSELVFFRDQLKINTDHVITFRDTKRKEFSYKPGDGLYTGWTVTFVCLQIAYWMGFTTALLVGIDHYYWYPEYTFPTSDDDRLYVMPVVSDGRDQNHFCVDYHEPGEQYMAGSDLRRMDESYQLAKEAWESHGRRILNLTEGTHCEVFEKADWRAW